MHEAATKDVTGSPDGRDLRAAFLAVEVGGVERWQR